MLCISHNYTNPYFNLASEEYLVKEFSEEIFMLWRNEPSVIVGRNQNTLFEINADYIREHSIPVVRRLSGGGAVFHDLGNLNFTFILNNSSENFTNFKKFTEPILDVLKKLSIDAKFSGRNDLTIDGKKISGNAQYYHKDRVLHHGTLLFSSVINDISSALNVTPAKLQGKGVKSVSSRVTNISEHLSSPLTIIEFIDMIMQHIIHTNCSSKLYEFTEADLNKINNLMNKKYMTWEWNFGSSPEYSLVNQVEYSGGSIEFNMDVKKGIISNIKIYGDFFGKKEVSDIENALKGVKHTREDIRSVLIHFDINEYFAGASAETLIDGLV